MQPDNVIGEFHYQQYPARLPPREGDRETHRHQVTIVGGGPVGLATALALARQGVASLIPKTTLRYASAAGRPVSHGAASRSSINLAWPTPLSTKG